MFHTLGADFLVISKGDIEIPKETTGEPIQGIPQLISQRSISVKELVEIANKDMLPPGEQGEVGIARREFVRALFIETSRQREEAKLITNVEDFRKRFRESPEQANTHYEAFLRYQFEGVTEGIDTSNPKWLLEQQVETLEEICRKTAASRVIGPVAERAWEKKIQAELKQITKSIDADAKAKFSNEAPNFRTDRRKGIEKVENYLDEPKEETFPKEELETMLRELGKEEIIESVPNTPEGRRRLANAIINRYTLEFDKMTGFKEKSTFSKDIERDIENGKTPNIAIIDLGYLKYFNYLGNRELGDHAIKKAAFIMEFAKKGLPEGVEIYRIGGDEFAIKADTPELVKRIQQRIQRAVEYEGDIPSDGKTHDYYEKQKLEFNVGECTPELAKRIYQEIRDEYIGEEGTEEEKQKHIQELLILISDLNLEMNKTIVRFRTIARKLNSIAGETDTEKFKKFLAFSGKALRGFSLDQLKTQIQSIDLQDQDMQVWEKAISKIKNEEFRYGNDYSEQLVERVKQAIRANR